MSYKPRVDPVRVLLLAIAAYFAIGALVALPFVAVGISRVDAAAKGSSIAFRILVLPGSVALWPLVLMKWIRGRTA